MPRLLVIDDEPLTLDCFRYLFPKEQVTLLSAATATEGLRLCVEQPPDAIVLDIRLPDLTGLEAFQRFHALDSKVPIILMTGFGTAETAIQAMRLGAYDYIVKPLDPDPLRQLIERALEISRLMRVPAKLAEGDTPDEASDLLIGNCAAMQEVYKAIGRVAPQDITVLILGESGTGKELAARAIYHYSRRSEKPFLAVNCAAIPEALLESELFGHEKGAFTGAERKRPGKFEQCEGGTLFLDEIGDMTPLTQAKVLRVLQDQTFERVGGNEPIRSNVRIIVATNRNLESMIAKGAFRSDLYYRLNDFTIRLPPLRERGDDLTVLVGHFLRRFSKEFGKDVSRISDEALEMLRNYSWPGNVRELQSAIKHAILQATGPVLVTEFLSAALRGDHPAQPATDASGASEFPDLQSFIQRLLAAGSTSMHAEVLAAIEKHLFLQVLRHTNSNVTQTARILGISRTTLRSKLGTLGIAVERLIAAEGSAE